MDEEISQREARQYKQQGNTLFVEGNYLGAISMYDKALEALNDKTNREMAIYFCNRAACNLKLGEYESTILDCDYSIDINPMYVKAYVRRYQAEEEIGKYHDCVKDLEKILEMDSTHEIANKELPRMKVLSNQQMEKEKDEMMGKLKELGNNILGKFNLSLDSFKMDKDPKTGGYNISMKK